MWVTPSAARGCLAKLPVAFAAVLAVVAPSGQLHAQATQPEQSAPAEQSAAAPSQSYSARARVVEKAPEPFAMRPAEADALENGLGDAFSVVESMPGVVPVFSGVPYLIVRGATPAGSLTYYDGISVPTLFHLALGPSLVNPRLAGPTRFMAGSADARYGAHIGGVLDRAGPSQATLATPVRYLRLSLLDASGLLNVPTRTGAVTLSWRYGTPGLMLRALGLDATLGYYHYQLRYETALSSHTRLSLVLLGANDHLGERTKPSEDIDITFARLLARLTTRVKRFELGSSLLLSSDASTLGQQLDGKALRVTQSAYLQWHEGNLQLRAGADLMSAAVKLVSGSMQASAAQQDVWTSTPLGRQRDLVLDPADFLDGQPYASVPNRSVLGAYAQLRWLPLPKLRVTTGLRVDAFVAGSDLEGAVSPMLRVRYLTSERFNLHAAVALAHKARTSPLPLPGLNDIAIDRGIEGALQSELGGSLRLDDKTSVEANVFYHAYQDVVYMELILDCQGNTDPSATPGVRAVAGAKESICRSSGLPTANGDSYGLELFVKRDLTQRLSGFISYTHGYAHATARDGERFAPQADVRHVLNAVLLYRLGAGFSLGARLHFRTGKVASNTVLDYFHMQAARLQYRLPSFIRLDLKLSYTSAVSFGRLTASIGLQNATFSREATNRDCMADGSQVVCEVDYQPYIVLPNVSLRANF